VIDSRLWLIFDRYHRKIPSTSINHNPKIWKI
jgi:hypothetical protein